MFQKEDQIKKNKNYVKSVKKFIKEKINKTSKLYDDLKETNIEIPN